MMISKGFSLACIFQVCFGIVAGGYTPKWSCDFEGGSCDWLQSQDDGLDWTNDIGSKWNMVDHTIGSLYGHFMLLRLSSLHSETGTGKLVSPLMRPTKKPCQMVFHYQGKGSSGYPLQLVIRILSKEFTKIFHKDLFNTTVMPNYWEKVELSIQSSAYYQLEIVGYIARSRSAYIAIDDVMFTSECLTDEETGVKILKPPFSSAFNFPEGVFYYLGSVVCEKYTAQYVCKLLRQNGLARDSLVIRGLYSSQRMCFPPEWNPPNATGCNLNTRCIDAIFWRCKQDHIFKCPDLTHKTCTSAFGTPKCYSHNQQCDYVNNCPGGEDEDDCHLFNRCNFKKDFCSWVPSKNITLKWKRYRDLGSGGYIIRLNSSVTQDKTEVSRLQLHGFIKGSTNLICVIRFSYRMLPWHNVVLRLVLKWPDESRTVWSRTQARNDMWRKEFLELRYSGIFELWFEAGGKPDVSIYIDLANVSFSKQCVFINESKALLREPASYFLCRNGQQISRKQMCNLNQDCLENSDELNCTYDKERCTFENSLCNWKVDQNVPITLTRRTSNAMHGFFGPQMDHTTNSTSGYYIHFDARKRLPEVFGQLISNVMQISSSRKCTFRWFYRIYQDGYFFTDKLLVIYYNPILKTEKKLWYVEGEQGANWKLGSVTFDITSFNYQIILRFERGDSFLSDIAVDDVSFSEECYKRNEYSPISIMQDCSIAKTFFTINGSTAAILFTFQQNMGNDVNCRWSIDTDSRLKIGLSADYFVTDPNDFLAMQSGNVDTNNTVGNFSGYIAPFYFISNSSRMEIHFHATQLNRSHGFALNLFSTDEKATALTFYQPAQGQPTINYYRVCNGPVFTKSRYQGRKTFKTPSSSYGSNLYSKNENCTYQFYVSQGYRLKFNFTKFDTENGSDYIEILNSAILGPQTFSGALQEFYFISKNSFLSFNFITNDVIEKEGCTFDVTATMESTRGATRYLKTVEPQVSTMSPTEQPMQFLTQTCDNYNSNLWPGDKYFGSTISLGHFSSYPRAINCSWTMPQKTGLKYVIEISYFYAARHLDALSISTISKSSPQLLSSLKKIKKLENLLVITDDPFLVKTIIASSHRRFAHAFTYSVYPGCYDASLKYVFFKDKNTESKEQCVSSCYKRDFQYAFFIVDIKNECYCDNMEPARRSRYMKHPRHCCIPPFTGSCNRGDSGVLLLSVDATATTTENKQSQDSGRIATIAASVSVFLVVAVIVGVVIFLRWRRKKSAASSHASLRKTSTHNSVEMEPIAFACELPAVRNSDNTLIKHGDRKNSADLSARS
ncbi:MAM and LDL-receptor class A domain-containing protein 2-like isoform X2 [Rhopilema esculentum]|uniref:MAM and LDL-receptor class A domain-containing protein 2-like isoform X2 n=1 Tax=Rhopilema esculentum TaxID=499914 RepID=UPI0031D4E845